MMKPSIHLNGTGAATLVEVYQDAIRANSAAIEALQLAAPNARDYYPQGPDAYPAASREHAARLHRLANNAAELMTLLESVLDQQSAREARRS